MSNHPEKPEFGRRLLASLLEQRAEIDSTGIYARVPLSAKAAGGFRDITYCALNIAVDRCAHFLDNQVGSAKATGRQTMAWVSWPQDFRYILLALAAMKTGHRIFLPSPKNSIAAHHALLDECSCSAFLRPSHTPLPIIDKLIRDRSMSVVEMPALDHFFENHEETVSGYSFSKSFEDARFDECLVLHTSGSTGIPKTIVVKNGYFSAIDAFHSLPGLGTAPAAFSLFGASTCFAPFPLFHAAGMIVHLAGPLFWDVTLTMGSSAPLTGATICEYLDHGGINTAFLPVATLVDISNDRALLERMSELQCVGMGGSPLPEEAGNRLSRKTRLVNLLGSTEAAKLPSEVVDDNDDWQFLRFGDKTGFEFRCIEGTEKHEMVIRREKDLGLLQAVFVTFPDLHEWHTGDIYTKHPKKPFHWKYESRSDDIIVFNTGEKLNPLTLQDAIASEPGVSGAIVSGSGRFQACLLVEPREILESHTDRQRFLADIWPAVQKANIQTVAHGRIDKHLMLATTPDKPLPRSGKGSIQRKLALQIYEKELGSLYERPSTPEVDDNLYFSDEATSIASLKTIFAQATDAEAPSESSNIFAQGVDSVQVFNVVRRINKALGRDAVTPQTVYTCETLQKLAQTLLSSVSDTGPGEASRAVDIEEVVEDLTRDLPVTVRRAATADCSIVMLTGSTGSLGSYLLDALLADPRVVHVYCLNRSKDAHARQTKASAARGLGSLFPPHRVTFMHADFSKEYFGVAMQSYLELLNSVTHVVHNAWDVNFNLALDSFTKTHVRGVRKLIDFSAHSKYGAHIYFISSIGAVQGCHSEQLRRAVCVPEKIFEDKHAPAAMGYAESKHAGERLLARAANVSGVPSTVSRLGQIAGPVKRGLRGMWSKQEWFPSLVITSGSMGVVPDSLGMMDEIDWLPVDVLAELLVDLTLQQKPGCDATQTGVHHLVNPHRSTWSQDLMQAVAASKKAKPISLPEWTSRLGELASDVDTDLSVHPAVKLLTFFDNLALGDQTSAAGKPLTLDTVGTRQRSSMLGEVDAVSREWMELWMRQWTA